MSTDKTWISLDAFEEAFARQDAELESLRQENSRLRFQLHTILDQKEAELKRLREALSEIASDGEFIRDCSPMHLAMIANLALNPPKS